ncbi:hypothetical protein C4544_05705 [candidate division WS5 bacterium]|uniref:Uncharacterized protein n=1 Tax=candidate division WS5 bacterium TaxID=2093353 RepID=A0A419DAY8_9BACT|nr:MAG: hypothetical protein C4544_05705 [candidate division WS5 bacterium]
MTNDEQKAILSEMFQESKVKIFIKDNGNLLATAQLLIAGIQEINGITIWKSKFDGSLNIQPPSYDPFHKCKAVWIKDEKLWHDICVRLEREYQNKREALGIDEAIEDIEF